VLVDSREPASYAQAIRELIAAPETLARLARGAREHASRFGWSVTVDGLLELYSDVMSESPAAVDAAAIDA
jgi:D-inositol-3-phosphate glycosyltransferase